MKAEHSKEDECMNDRRKTPRIKEENDVTITVIPGENNFPKEKIIDNFTKDISGGGAKIQTNILLPVDSLIELEFTSKGLRQQINSLGTVKWVKVLIEDESYEAGVEFSGNPSDAIKKLEDYISWKLKSNKAELIKRKLSPVDSEDTHIAEVKESPPVDSVHINDVKIKEQPPLESAPIHDAKAKERPPRKNRRWIIASLIALSAMSLIIILFILYGYMPEFDSVTSPAPPIASSVPKARQTPVSEAIPSPEQEVTQPPSAEITTAPIPEAIPAPAPVPAPAPEEPKKIKVIGNSDSKKYHLPGMKYYKAVKAYHRVEFDSEADAIKAGYNKAPQ